MNTASCHDCRNGMAIDFDISMAFQPIVDLRSSQIWAYEALVRGNDATPAADILAKVGASNRYAFDQRCRVVAIERAVAAGILDTGARLSINFLPDAVYSPKACIKLTMATAAAVRFPVDRLIFEFTEQEKMSDPDHVMGIVEAYRDMGFMTALDDFGSGYAGLGLLTQFQPDVIKLDMELLRGIDQSSRQRTIVGAIVDLCGRLGGVVVAEGIETRAELDAVRSLGINLVQGFLFARPAFEALPRIAL